MRKAGWALLTVLPLLFLELSWHSDSLPARTLPQQTAKHPTVPSCPRAEKPFCAFLGQADICGRSFLGKADICGRSSKQTERDVGLAVDVEKYLSYCLTGGTNSKWCFPDLRLLLPTLLYLPTLTPLVGHLPSTELRDGLSGTL